jgi:DNA-directed RNA polymerase specialized sigma24 family protein
MSSTASALPAASCSTPASTTVATTPSRPVPDRMVALVQEVARGDRGAFVDLHDAMFSDVVAQIGRTPLEPTDAAAIASATFVEVWSLARFHAGQDANVRGWIVGIAARRAAGRLRGGDLRCDPGPAARRRWRQATDSSTDRRTELLLAALLGRPTNATMPAVDRPVVGPARLPTTTP